MISNLKNEILKSRPREWGAKFRPPTPSTVKPQVILFFWNSGSQLSIRLQEPRDDKSSVRVKPNMLRLDLRDRIPDSTNDSDSYTFGCFRQNFGQADATAATPIAQGTVAPAEQIAISSWCIPKHWNKHVGNDPVSICLCAISGWRNLGVFCMREWAIWSKPALPRAYMSFSLELHFRPPKNQRKM